jgi:hypothetical protein
MDTMTLDQMLSKLQKDMKERHHPDWLGWVSQNKVFKLKNIDIDSVSPADGWQGNKDNIDNMFKSNLSDAPIIVVHKNGGIIDGNHRHQALKKQGAKTIQAYVGEGKMEFKLIDKEISEARLWRQSRQFGEMDGRGIADLLYLSFLSLLTFAKDDYKSDYAKAYARQTSQYGTFTMFRSHATDIYLLAYQVKNPKNKHISLKNNIESTRFLKSLSFDSRKFYFILSKIARGNLNKSEISTYLFRLEAQLKISNANFKQYRRYINDWENLKFAQRQYVTSKLIQDFRRLGRGSEMVSSLSDMAKYKKYRISDEVKSRSYKKPKPSATSRVVGTAAGAIAGRYVGKKVAKKLGKDIDKYKKYGTGIGAIAGYWASGRKKQQ